jgi:DNA repair exonuclease SbcCD ATPase subunit
MNTSKYDVDVSKYEANLQKGNEAEYKARYNLSEKQKKLNYFTTTDECAECEQPIDPTYKKKQLDEISAEITKLKIKHSKIKSELGKLDNFRKRIEKYKLDKITPLDEKIAALDEELAKIKRSWEKDEAETKVIYHQGLAAIKRMGIFKDGRDKLKDDAKARIAIYEDIAGAIGRMEEESECRVTNNNDSAEAQIKNEKNSTSFRIAEHEKKIAELGSQEKGKLKDEVEPRRDVARAETRKKDLAFKKIVHDVTIAILSDKGIKTYIIKRYIPKLNKMVNQYLDILSASYKLSFDEDLEEKIALKGYEKLSYNNFSEGERQRCDIALLFAFLDIGKMKNSVTSNLLLMDEVVDRSLDDNGIRGIINIIDSMKTKGFTIVNISHKHQLSASFDVTYRATKDKFSYLEKI